MGSKADFHCVTKVKDVKGTLRLWQEFRQFIMTLLTLNGVMITTFEIF